MPYKLLCIVFLCGLGLFTACSGNNTPKTEQSATPTETSIMPANMYINGQYFPVQKEFHETVLAAMMTGELKLDESGYLRLYDALIIWPHGFSCVFEGKTILIVDAKSQVVAKVGDVIKIGGGEVPLNYAQEALGQSLPKNCQGPYWLTGEFSLP
jgi:hypothetical protein